MYIHCPPLRSCICINHHRIVAVAPFGVGTRHTYYDPLKEDQHPTTVELRA